VATYHLTNTLKIEGDYGSIDLTYVANNADRPGFVRLDTFQGNKLIALQMTPEKLQQLIIYLDINRSHFGL
jgi:hypothetical protein